MVSEDLVAEFTSFREILDHFASNLSEEGVFLEVEPNGGVGSEVGFQIRIRDGFAVLAGQAEIVGTTETGVFLRLTYLDQPSLKLLPKLLEHYRRRGLPLLELPPVEEEVDRQASQGLEAQVKTVEEEPVLELAPELEPIETAVGSEVDSVQPDEPIEPVSEEVPLVTLDDVESELQGGTGPESESDDDRKAVEVSPADVDPGPSEPAESTGAWAVEATELEPTSPEEEGREEDEIHLTELLDSAGGSEGTNSDVGDSAESLPAVDLDAGLSWLPDDAEQRTTRERWVILLLILAGVVLGALFYFFVLRAGDTTSAVPWRSEPVAAAALPAALPRSEPPPQMASSQGVPSAPEPVSEPAASGPPPTTVERISWEGAGEETVITLWADGSFAAGQVDEFRVDEGSPRAVIRIRGIRRPFAESEIDLGTSHVQRLRTGLHQDRDGSSLHIVADLVDDGVRVQRTEAVGQQLRIYFSKTG